MKGHIGAVAWLVVSLRIIIDAGQGDAVVVLNNDWLWDIVGCIDSLALVSVRITAAIVVLSCLELIVHHDQKAKRIDSHCKKS